MRITSNLAADARTISDHLISEYERDSKTKLTEAQIDKIRSSIKTQLSSSSPLDVTITETDFPEKMKIWALAKKALNIEKTTSPYYTFEKSDWSDIDVVQRSNEGQHGVWFFVNSKQGSVVVKGQNDLEKQLMGSVFLRGMNFNAPDAKIVPRKSTEGKQIAELGEKTGLNARDPSQYMVMNRVYGPSLHVLTSSAEDIQLVSDHLENLGELAVYDLILGNFDRFQLDSMSFNAGNIMFQDNSLHPIDTDCQHDEARFPFTKLALKKIIAKRDDFDDKIARKLAENMGKGVPLETFSREKIRAGMNKAIDRLIEFHQNLEQQKERFTKSCLERGVEDASFPSHMEELLNYIAKQKETHE